VLTAYLEETDHRSTLRSKREAGLRHLQTVDPSALHLVLEESTG
jgi:hypothetical protein